ncbi:FtsX-like permease family protein [Plasticicumulans acidivorans]|uniref:Putative ABC transport system permease protein n=1 Tax=Plasticicumulans acidivorans TaxID=886464 RepID=A0A317MTH9_9GAMM|nr:FtsX-like permease family protein [Plasticicumulans acidivorans]PWV61028.1 putative ABC transport system permease protein [Plasticicumulans acidivorans]
MIRFILADLRRLWLGALVIVLLVALASALGVTVTLQERALRLGSARAADKFDLVIGAPGSDTQLVLSTVFLQPAALPLLPGEVLRRLAADARVAWVAPIGFGDSFFDNPIVGTTTTLLRETTPGLAAGRLFAAEGEAVVGAAVELPLGASIKPMHGLAGAGAHVHEALSYRVVGRLLPTATAWDRAILVPIQAVWHIHGLGLDEHDEAPAGHEHDESAGDQATDAGHEPVAQPAGSAGPAAVRADADGHAHAHLDAAAPLDESWRLTPPGLPALLVKPRSIADAYRLRQAYRNEHTLAVFPGEVLTRLYATLGDARRVLALVAGGAQALVAASLVLVTVLHVGQRRRQIGALRAFGAPRAAVFAIVWSELFALVGVGIGLGFAIGYGAARLIAAGFTAQSGVVLPVGFVAADLLSAGWLLGFAALLAALPAALAYRQSPAQALRG